MGVMAAQGREQDMARAANLAENLLALEEKERKRLEGAVITAPSDGRRARKKAAPPAEIDRGRWRAFDVSDFWRLRTWAAWILQAAGRREKSLALAEAVLAEEVNPSEVNSLARPTLLTVRGKSHVKTRVAQNPDRESMIRVFSLAAEGNLDEALRLAERITLPRYRARARAGVATKLANREQALSLWLAGIVDARRVGQGLVVDVLKRGRNQVLGESAQGRAVAELDRGHREVTGVEAAHGLSSSRDWRPQWRRSAVGRVRSAAVRWPRGA